MRETVPPEAVGFNPEWFEAGHTQRKGKITLEHC